MKKTITLFLLIAVIPIILGMSSLTGETSPEKIPVPEKKFRSTFIDQMDIMTECNNTSIEGGTFLEGKVGAGSYTVPFDRINYILFRLQGDRLIADVKLTDGAALALTVDKSQKAYGQTKYGTFQIKLADIKKMVLERHAK